MPVRITKTKKGCYRVSTPGGVKAKCTTRAKAHAQRRIIDAAEGRPAKTTKGSRSKH